MSAWVRSRARQAGAELAAADRRLVAAAAAASAAGAVYVATGWGLLLGLSVIAACVCALLAKGESR